jgi:DNA transposition AAA+ family ATPase
MKTPDPDPAPDSEQTIPSPRLPTRPDLPTAADVRLALGKQNASEDIIGAALWLLDTADEHGLTTLTAIAKFAKMDVGTVSKFFRGQYTALAALTDRLLALRADFEARNAATEAPFVAGLSVVRDITTIAEIAFHTGQLALIWGKNQTGKTWALESIHRRTDRDTLLFAIEEGGGTNATVANAADAAGIPSTKSSTEAWNRVRRRVTNRTLVMVDEFHQCFIGRSLRMATIEKVRRLHDRKKCPMLIVGTDIIKNMMEDERFTDFLGQIGNRSLLRLFIPTAPTAADLRLLYQAYGLPEPTGEPAKIAKDIATKNGIGLLTKYFRIARQIAKDGKLTWKDFNSTYSTLLVYSTTGRKEEAK